MKKITLIYDFLKELGGLERVMFFQANKLKKHSDLKLFFSYISKKERKKIINELELDKNIGTYPIGSNKGEVMQLALSFLFPSRFLKINSDLIISHSFMANRMAYYKKNKDGTPYVVMLYHPPNFLYSSVEGWANTSARIFAKFLGLFFREKLKKIDIKCVRGADRVIAISEYTAKRVRQIYNVTPEIVYPQISKSFKIISEKEKKQFVKEKNIKNKFVYAHGRIIPDKNYLGLLTIIKKLENVDLIISGSIDDLYRQKLETKIKQLNLGQRVKIMGKIPKEDLLGYYNCAELFLMSAPREDFGLTMVEAMACGCPVIGWDDKAGPSEIIIKNENGLLAKPYDKNDFTKRIEEGLVKKWNSKNIANSVEKFSEKEVGSKFIEVLGKFID